MDLKVVSEKNNELFGRKEIAGTINSDVTPSREEVLNVLSEKFSAPKENIKIKGIHGKFGSKEFSIEANIYNSPEEKNIVEIKKKKEADAEKRAQEAAEAAKAEAEKPKEEKPVEESKPEENKEEEKTE